MKGTTLTVSTIMLLAATSTAFADDDHFGKRYNACIDKSGGGTSTMLACAAAENARQNKRLNTNYRKLMKALPADYRQDLRTAERLWIKLRKADCNFNSDLVGGTLGVLSQSECLIRQTAKRADLLADDLHDWNSMK